MAEETKKAEAGKEDSSAKGADSATAAAASEQQEVGEPWFIFIWWFSCGNKLKGLGSSSSKFQSLSRAPI